MIASYSVKSDPKYLTSEVNDEEGVRRLLDLVNKESTDGIIPTVLLSRDDKETLSLSPRPSGEIYLVWVGDDDDSWSTTGGVGSHDEDVPFMFFGTYSEAYGDQFVPRDQALKAAAIFIDGGTRDSLGVKFEQD